MKCKLTNGNQQPGEYMVRELNPNQLYEVIRDGFTVEMVPEAKVKYVNLDNGTIVKRNELSDDYYEALKVIGAIWKEFER